MKAYIALDIGGTFVKYGLVTEQGEVLVSDRMPTNPEEGRERLVARLVETAERLRGAAEGLHVAGIGVSTAGIVDSSTGEVVGGVENIPHWKHVQVKRELESRTGLETKVVNDVNAMALGEAWMGAGRGEKTFVCIALGTGVGGAIVIDSKLYEGARFRAAEIGYMRTNASQTDCYERRAATSALVRRARELLPAGAAAPRELDGKAIFQQALAGDAYYGESLNAWLDDVAQGIADVICMLDPGLIIVGGGVSEQKTFLTERLAAIVERYLPEDLRGGTAIVPAVCGNKAGMLGAVSLFVNERAGAEE
ncbi:MULTISPECIES: ROK family protein [unclassified Paenibacillus]|uniref:ROK family protein n=1 Tax=unclassified Paenibacillus TaxID=185978 RepID=UPI001C106F23|nr:MULTISPECIES: ROK family protein [unclassified Paenibacillus]MBU5442554.1 ROK family protein [Paenibacillus sp. MSJ-34]CAH0120637.1 Beta-glucoside kinase [Paenibacillus sp. CECT 9249]